MKEELTFLPVSVNITGRKIVIVGGGKIGYHKASVLRRFTEEATVVSPVFHDGFGELPFKLERKTYERSDLDGAFLVYVCTENEALNARVKDDARSLGIMACVCDNSALCDFISPAIYQSGDVTVAVSTGGRDVRRSIAIRNRIGELMQNGEL